MLSESLKTNTTLTTLYLSGDKNEVKENDREEENESQMKRMIEREKGKEMIEMKHEQTTILEMKELE